MTEPYALSATEMLAHYRQRTLSPVEVMQSVLGRIAAWEPALKATYLLDGEGALAAARESEARWQADEPIGPLDGVPVTIKDNIATKGQPVPLGTAAADMSPAAADAPPAARLKEAGAIVVTKTTMPDYGMLSSGLSSFHPLTRNPWDLSKNPGGSSSGAGAGAAALYGPLHLGTDIGGSVRLPAGWCGIVALKPSLGRVPIDPPYYGRVAGPMTRTVDDAALMMSVLSLPDRRDHMSLPFEDVDWSRTEIAGGGSKLGVKLGVMLDVGAGFPVDPEVRAAVEAAAKAFADAGAEVEEMKPFITRDMLEGLDRFWRTRSWSDISAMPEARQRKVLPFIHDWAAGAQGISGLDVFRGFDQIMVMRAAANAACEPFDYILSPTAPMAAFPAELPCPTNDPKRPFEHICFTLPFNMSEQPAASINCGYTSAGLPIGLQIIGQRFYDLGVLRVARGWERIRPAQRPWPEPPKAG